MKKNADVDEKQLNKALFELTKQSNLYEYTKDIIKNTEQMSFNKIFQLRFLLYSLYTLSRYPKYLSTLPSN